MERKEPGNSVNFKHWEDTQVSKKLISQFLFGIRAGHWK
jgi:hypothetical protein